MIRPVLLLFAVAMTAVLLARSAAPVAHACTYGPETPKDTRVEESDIIVAGRVSGWKRIENPELPSGFESIPISVVLEVERVIKGTVVGKVEFVDFSLNADPRLSGQEWGFDTDCGPVGFQKDPTQTYLVIGLTHAVGSGYGDRPVRGPVFYQGDVPPADPLSTLGLGEDSDRDKPIVLIISLGTVLVLLPLLGAAFVWRRRSAR